MQISIYNWEMPELSTEGVDMLIFGLQLAYNEKSNIKAHFAVVALGFVEMKRV